MVLLGVYLSITLSQNPLLVGPNCPALGYLYRPQCPFLSCDTLDGSAGVVDRTDGFLAVGHLVGFETLDGPVISNHNQHWFGERWNKMPRAGCLGGTGGVFQHGAALPTRLSLPCKQFGCQQFANAAEVLLLPLWNTEGWSSESWYRDGIQDYQEPGASASRPRMGPCTTGSWLLQKTPAPLAVGLISGFGRHATKARHAALHD